jgi:hypothetical protein
MTDKELVERAFPPKVRQELERVLDELNAERSKPRKPARKPRKR